MIKCVCVSGEIGWMPFPMWDWIGGGFGLFMTNMCKCFAKGWDHSAVSSYLGGIATERDE